jgi:hypothetical protein
VVIVTKSRAASNLDSLPQISARKVRFEAKSGVRRVRAFPVATTGVAVEAAGDAQDTPLDHPTHRQKGVAIKPPRSATRIAAVFTSAVALTAAPATRRTASLPGNEPANEAPHPAPGLPGLAWQRSSTRPGRTATSRGPHEKRCVRTSGTRACLGTRPGNLGRSPPRLACSCAPGDARPLPGCLARARRSSSRSRSGRRGSHGMRIPHPRDPTTRSSALTKIA